jgi:hypothetical protein
MAIYFEVKARRRQQELENETVSIAKSAHIWRMIANVFRYRLRSRLGMRTASSMEVWRRMMKVQWSSRMDVRVRGRH